MRRRRPRVQAETLSVTESELKGGARRVLRDLLVVVAILGAAGIAFGVWYLSSRHTLQNDRPLAGLKSTSRMRPQIQSETTIAIEPLNPRDLLAGSNDELYVTRVYTSRDGGTHWRSLGGPPLASRAQCGFGDPTIAVSGDGSEYYGFLANLSCNQPEFVHISSSPRGRNSAANGTRSPWQNRAARGSSGTTNRRSRSTTAQGVRTAGASISRGRGA